MKGLASILLALTAGLYFAACQVGYFIHLEFNLSSTFVSYYTMLGAWILGTLAGLALRRRGLGLPLVMGGLAAYYLHGWLVIRFPYDMRWLPFYLLCVFCTALYGGYFFREARAQFPTAKSLFFHENNGFLAGYLVAGLAVLLHGQTSQRVLPLVAGLGHLLLLAVVNRLSAKADTPA